MAYNSNMYRKTESKHADIKYHFKKRFAQRFNIELTKELYDKIMSQIKNGSAILVEKQSNTRNLYNVKLINKKHILVIYNKKYKLLQTCFPLEWYGSKKYCEAKKIRDINKCASSYSGVYYDS